MKSDFGNKWLRGSLLKWDELKSRKWDLNAHLISTLDLKLSQPLDLGIPQKSLRVRLKEEKEEKIINSFMRRLREGEKESKGDFWAMRRWRTKLGTQSRQHFSKSVQQGGTDFEAILGTIFKAVHTVICFNYAWKLR